MLAEAALLAVLLQSTPTVALIIDGQERIVSVAEAERLLQSPDVRFRAAAVIALGTRATIPEPHTLERHDLERERFQRQPAQRPVPDSQ